MKKTKFTVLDAIIIIVFIAAVLFGTSKIFPGMFSGGEEQQVKFIVLASDLDDGMENEIEVGEKVQISFSDMVYATVTGVEKEPAINNEFNTMTGEYIEHETDGKCDIKVSLEAPVEVTDTQIKNGSVQICVGQEIPVRGKGYSIKGFIIEVEDKQNDN